MNNDHDAIMIEGEPHRFSAFASDLGFAPGEWPKTFETHKGNKQPFRLFALNGDRAIYRQDLGCILVTIFND